MSDHLLNDDGEVVVELADGWTLRSGAEQFTSGEYVRLVRPDGTEYAYWDNAEWQEDPVLVMGAILNSAAGLRMGEGNEDPVCNTCDDGVWRTTLEEAPTELIELGRCPECNGGERL